MRRALTLAAAATTLTACSLLVPSPDDFEFGDGDAGVPRDAGPDGGSVDGGADGGPPSDAGPDAGCVGDERLCTGSCVDTSTSLEHCGMCGMACEDGWLCRAGSCVDPVVEVAADGSHTCARRGSGEVWCWGKSQSGQLGRGDFTDDPSPGPVVGLEDAVNISTAGFGFGGFFGVSCAARRGGRAVCWGENADGIDVRNAPTDVGDINRAVRVETGYYQSCALLPISPHLLCWGVEAGAMPPGPIETPQAISGVPPSVDTYRDLTMALSHGCIVDRSGGVWCWGGNLLGQLGDGTTESRTFAAEVPGLSGIGSVVASALATCALSSTGAVWCWGAANLLGNGGTTDDPVPMPQEVVGLTEVERLYAASAGRAFCARRTDGSTWCWGYDVLGSLETGTEVWRSVPTHETRLDGFELASLGVSHLCAWDADGQLYCAGSNSTGELGDGTTTPRLALTPVVGL